MKYFTPIDTWSIPESALEESCREMARDGSSGNEGVALWLGQRHDGRAHVTHVIVLRGPDVVKRPDQLTIRPQLLNLVTNLAIEYESVLIGQIHSHGQMYGTDLSYADRTLGITVPYFLSIVAPDYALRPCTRLEDCGIHVFEPGSGFRRLSANESAHRVLLVPSADVPVLTVGEK